jgi:hypothetical protein
MTRRVPGVIGQRDLRSALAVPAFIREIFFIIFVDGIFTTFIARLFTNPSDAIRANPVMSCV